jgi:Cyclin, C-terminal domain
MCRILKIADATSLQYQRACNYSKRSLQEYDMLAYRPPMIAAADVYLARLYDVDEVCDVHLVLCSVLLDGASPSTITTYYLHERSVLKVTRMNTLLCACAVV